MTTIVNECDPVVPRSYSRDTPPSAHFYEAKCGERQKRLAVRAGVALPWPALSDAGINDRITTLVVPPNTRATVYADTCMKRNGGATARACDPVGHGFELLRNTDAPGQDIENAGTTDQCQLISKCHNDGRCKGFNPLGWLKNDLKYQPSSTNLYVKKSNKDCQHIRQFGPGEYFLPSEKYLSGRGMNDSISEIRVDSIRPHSEWLRDCCLGKISPVSSCANFANPNGQDCISVLSDHCSNPKNFFTADCKRWVSNLNDAQRNNIANAACPSATTDEEKDWCACYLLKDIPPELEKDDVMRGLWACLDPVCNNSSKSLQPFGKDCPSSLTLCNQRDIVTKLGSSEIGSQRLANECGNISLPDTSPTGPMGPAAPGGIPRSWILAGGAAGFLLMILLLVGILFALRRK